MRGKITQWKDALDYVSVVLVVLSLAGAVYSFIQTGSIEKAIPLGVILVVAVVLLNRQKKSKEKIFTCARCRKVSEHIKRTIWAWNNVFLKLYCEAYHRKWLAERPKQVQQVAVSSQARGCLGVPALLVILPLLVGVGVYQWIT